MAMTKKILLHTEHIILWMSKETYCTMGTDLWSYQTCNFADTSGFIYEVCEKTTRKVSVVGVLLFWEARSLDVSYSTTHYVQKLLLSTDWARHLRRARRAGPRLVAPTPRTQTLISDIRNFAARFAIAGKGYLTLIAPAGVHKGHTFFNCL